MLRQLKYSQSIPAAALPGRAQGSTAPPLATLTPTMRRGQRSRTTVEPHVPVVAPIAEASADTQVTRVLHLENGRVISVRMRVPPPPQTSVNPSINWYKCVRMLVSLGFLLMLLVTLFVQRGLADGTLKSLSNGLSYLRYGQFGASDIHMASHITAINASHITAINASRTLVRISQLDPAQYNSMAEYNTWAYSACSTASMTEVFNAYGRHFRITDVLQVEARIGAITPQLGLVDSSGIQATAAQFGFKTTWSNSWNLDTIINIANSGKPVIVDFPPDRYDGGHLLVLLGGSSSEVYLADSSSWNRHVLSRGQFLNWWEGFGAVVTPVGQ